MAANDPARLAPLFFTAFAGRFFASLGELLWLGPATMPPVLVVALRLALRRAERARPATALLALHDNTPLSTLAGMIAAAAAWATTANLARRERLAWLVLMAAGDVLALHLGWLWKGAAGAWLRALLGSG